VAVILPLTETEAANRPRLVQEAGHIFFETANVQDFDSQAERDAFYERWFGHYLGADPSLFLLALDETGAAIGYLAGCLDSFSQAARAIIGDISLYTPAFCAALRDYPSHFHINVKPGHQGRGIGRRLIERFLQLCRERGSPGIHVATGSGSRAVSLYRTCGFTPFAPPEPNSTLALLVCAIPAP
jgi:GNAT superfamily N-acetyltransferase